MRRAAYALSVLLLALPAAAPVLAQDRDRTLADIRQELNVLFVEVQKLKREMSTTGSPQVDVAGSTVLDRVAAMEAELQRLTAQAERLENRVQRIVTDGTNRIGDLEFRLVELEGGDVSRLGETTTLGGPVEGGTVTAGVAETGQTGTETTEMAMGEEADFKAGQAALDAGDNARAAEIFTAFNSKYPGSPLAAEAEMNRGRALDGLGDTREAARAYLAAFTANTAGPVAPNALFRLGASLGRLGQTEQACITLGEVEVRFPAALVVGDARAEMSRLGCG